MQHTTIQVYQFFHCVSVLLKGVDLYFIMKGSYFLMKIESPIKKLNK